MFAYIFSLLGNRTQAEDVMQETNAILWRKAHEFKLGTNFGAWMLRVAYFQVMAHRRKITRDRHVFDDDFIADISDDAQQQSESHEENNDYRRLYRETERTLPETHPPSIHRRCYSEIYGFSKRSVREFH